MEINLKSLLLVLFCINSKIHSLDLAVNYKTALNPAEKQIYLAIAFDRIEKANDNNSILMIINPFREIGHIKELADYINSKKPEICHKIKDALLKVSIDDFTALIEKTKKLIRDGKKKEAEIEHTKIISVLNPVRLQTDGGQKLYEIYLLNFCFDTDPKIQAYCKGGLAAL